MIQVDLFREREKTHRENVFRLDYCGVWYYPTNRSIIKPYRNQNRYRG